MRSWAVSAARGRTSRSLQFRWIKPGRHPRCACQSQPDGRLSRCNMHLEPHRRFPFPLSYGRAHHRQRPGHTLRLPCRPQPPRCPSANSQIRTALLRLLPRPVRVATLGPHFGHPRLRPLPDAHTRRLVRLASRPRPRRRQCELGRANGARRPRAYPLTRMTRRMCPRRRARAAQVHQAATDRRSRAQDVR